MKKTMFTLLFVLFTVSVYSQSFEGRIIYKASYLSKKENTSNEQWGTMLGTHQEYFIQGGEYFAKMNGSLFEWQRYTVLNNRYYFKLGNSDKAYWKDAASNDDPAILIAHNKAVTEILGHKCDELVFKNKSGIHKYYFSSYFILDSKLFINHKYGNWYEYLSKANALPLKEVVDAEDFLMEIIATEVIPEKLDNSVFGLPKDLVVEKSPF